MTWLCHHIVGALFGAAVLGAAAMYIALGVHFVRSFFR